MLQQADDASDRYTPVTEKSPTPNPPTHQETEQIEDAVPEAVEEEEEEKVEVEEEEEIFISSRPSSAAPPRLRYAGRLPKVNVLSNLHFDKVSRPLFLTNILVVNNVFKKYIFFSWAEYVKYAFTFYCEAARASQSRDSRTFKWHCAYYSSIELFKKLSL